MAIHQESQQWDSLGWLLKSATSMACIWQRVWSSHGTHGKTALSLPNLPQEQQCSQPVQLYGSKTKDDTFHTHLLSLMADAS